MTIIWIKIIFYQPEDTSKNKHVQVIVKSDMFICYNILMIWIISTNTAYL